ncbi:response regulator [Kordiimonas aquimaris]|uniref:response regulator n=1 Tax=Kordiimonas aquimaris TaxID=707591 RepID=UPI0021D1B9CC|nr:response regulator [Kordiimonas aquimaris]
MMVDATSTNPDQIHDIKLLVVEDNPVMVSILGRVLKKMDIRFAVAGNGKEAVEACQEKPFSLILMDINMPGMGGVEATQHIRKLSAHYSEAPIVAVTANLSSEDLAEYKNAGMTDYVKKPVNQVDLHRVIEAYASTLHADHEAPYATSKIVPPELQEVSDDELDALNWEVLREYGAIMKGDIAKLLEGYLKAGPEMMNALAEAVYGKDGKRLEHLAHKLKSTSIVFGAESVSAIAAQLEACGKSGKMDGASALHTELHICFERTNHVLKKRLTLMKMGM